MILNIILDAFMILTIGMMVCSLLEEITGVFEMIQSGNYCLWDDDDEDDD